jgi:hypothetical protein
MGMDMVRIENITRLSSLWLVLVVLTLGVAYGLWTDALSISGTVTTGEVEVNFTDFDRYDSLKS